MLSCKYKVKKEMKMKIPKVWFEWLVEFGAREGRYRGVARNFLEVWQLFPVGVFVGANYSEHHVLAPYSLLHKREYLSHSLSRVLR